VSHASLRSAEVTLLLTDRLCCLLSVPHVSPGGVTPDSCEASYGIDNAGPVVVDGSVYFTSEHTGWRVFAVDTATGRERWNATTPDTKSATQPAVGGGAVFFAVLRGTQASLVSLDAETGRSIWDKLLPGVKGVAAPPRVSGGTLYISLDTGLHAFSAATGAAIWAQTNLTACSNTVPFVDVGAGIVYAARGKGRGGERQRGGVVALDARTGQPRWTAIPGVDNPWASPVLSGDQVFIAGFETNGGMDGGYESGIVYALSARSGSLMWKSNLTDLGSGSLGTSFAPILAQATAAGSDGVTRLFVAGAMWNLFALDVATGDVSWRGSTSTCGHLWMTPFVSSGTVYAGCDNGVLFAFAASSGAQQWKFTGSPGWAARSPVVADGRVFVGFNGRHDAGAVPDKMVVFAE
jgi:outer membrane protein assembly factor BamB